MTLVDDAFGAMSFTDSMKKQTFKAVQAQAGNEAAIAREPEVIQVDIAPVKDATIKNYDVVVVLQDWRETILLI